MHGVTGHCCGCEWLPVFAVVDGRGGHPGARHAGGCGSDGYGSRRLRAAEKTWHREDTQQWAEIHTQIFPNYQLPIESYMKVQGVQKNNEDLDSMRG